MVEKMNQTVEDCLKKCMEKQDDWEEMLDSVLFGIRVSRHSSTGVSPYRMVYNKDPVLPFEYQDMVNENPEMSHCINKPDTFQCNSLNDLIDDLEKQRKQVFGMATVNITKAQKHQAKNYNNRKCTSESAEFALGDRVLKLNMKDKSRKAKMRPKMLGPYTITGKCRSGYLLKDRFSHQLKRPVPSVQLVRYYTDRKWNECTDQKIDVDFEYDADSEREERCSRSSQFDTAIGKNGPISSNEIAPGQIIIIDSKDGAFSSDDNSMLVDVVNVSSPNNFIGETGDNLSGLQFVSDLHNEDELSFVSELAPGPVFFKPLSLEEIKSATDALFIKPKLGNQIPFRGIGEIFSGPPVVTTEAKPNGACLFNSVSLFLTGVDYFATNIRHVVCNYIAEERNKKTLCAHIPTKFTSGKDYINQSGMRSCSTWGTDLEIFALAQIIKKDVVVFTEFGNWVRHPASNSLHQYTENAVYLTNHTSNHFDPVFLCLGVDKSP